MSPPSPERILFLRSVPLPQARAALRWVREQFPNAHLTVLTSEATRAPIAAAGGVDDTAVYRAPRFGLRAAGLGVLATLGRGGFDKVVVPHVGGVDGSWNVARLALAVGGRHAFWLQCGPGETYRLTRVSVRPPLSAWWRRSAARRGLRAALVRASITVAYAAGLCFLGVLAIVLLALNLLFASPSSRSSA